MSVRDHYESPLAEHYSRMFGDFEAKVAEQRAPLERLGVGPPHRAAIAVDLSCGSGLQVHYARPSRISDDGYRLQSATLAGLGDQSTACRAASAATSGGQRHVFTVPGRGALAMIAAATSFNADVTVQMLQSSPHPRHASGGESLSKSVRNRR